MARDERFKVHGAGVWLRLATIRRTEHYEKAFTAVVVDLSVATNVHRFAYILFDFVGTAVFAQYFFFSFFQCRLSISGEVLANVGKWNINDNDADKQQHRFYSWWLIISHLAWLSLHWRWRMCVRQCACICIRHEIERFRFAMKQVCCIFLRFASRNEFTVLEVECGEKSAMKKRHPNRLWRWSATIKLERHRTFITIYMQTVKDKWGAADVEHSYLAPPNSTTKIV